MPSIPKFPRFSKPAIPTLEIEPPLVQGSTNLPIIENQTPKFTTEQPFDPEIPFPGREDFLLKMDSLGERAQTYDPNNAMNIIKNDPETAALIKELSDRLLELEKKAMFERQKKQQTPEIADQIMDTALNTLFLFFHFAPVANNAVKTGSSLLK